MNRPPGIPPQYKGKAYRHSWPYHDPAGEVIGFTARFEDSTGKEVIPYFTRNGAGWKPGAPPEPRLLLGLDALAKAAPGETAYVCEGEKCATLMQALGFTACTSQGGSKAAGKANWTPLQAFRRVVILPDNDEPGEDYARDVVNALAALPGSREVLIARLPGLPPAGDVIDWLQQRLPGWCGYTPPPREAGDDLTGELLEAIDGCAVSPPAEWLEDAGPEPWEAPVPLEPAQMPEWPRDIFPQPVQEFVDAVIASTETLPELVTLAVLPVLATAVQGKYRVRLKPDYFQGLNLWTCCALPPGSRKTQVHRLAIKPLVQWEKQQKEALEADARRVESERGALAGRAKHLQAKAAKEDDPAERERLIQELAETEASIPPPVVFPRVYAQDITPEHLATLLEQHGETLGLFSDEGGIFDTIAGRYSNGVPNLDVFLQAHEGSSVRVDRGSRPPVVLHNPYLSIGITPQPDVIAALEDKPGFRGRGFLGRFLYAVPESNIGRRTGNTTPIPPQVEARYLSLVLTLIDRGPAHDSNGEETPHILHLAPDAREAWETFARRVEAAMAPGGCFEHVPDWAGKFPAAVARIAAVLHLARHAYGSPVDTPIAGEDMAAALRLGESLGKHALIAFDCMGADAALEGARLVLAWIQREGRDSFTQREAHQSTKHKLRTTESVAAALAVLEDRGHIRRIESERKPGRPSLTFEVNPVIGDLSHD